MLRYIIKRVLQAIPLLFFISLILFFLMMNMGDPIAAMAGRNVTRSSDRAAFNAPIGPGPTDLYAIYLLVGRE